MIKTLDNRKWYLRFFLNTYLINLNRNSLLKLLLTQFIYPNIIPNYQILRINV